MLKALKALAVGAALAPFLVGSAYAHEPHHTAEDGSLVYSAIVELGGGWLATSDVEDDADREISDGDFGVVEGAARASIPLASNASIQFDLDGMLGINERDEGEESGDEYLQNFFFASLHLTLRDSSTGALGILGSYGESNGGDDDEAQVLFGGLEAQAYLGPYTLYAQGGYMAADDETEGDVITDAYWARLAGRAFLFDDNARLQVEVAYISGDENADDHTINGWAYGGRFDHAPGGGPVSYFIGYRGSYIENHDSSNDRLRDHTGLIGVALRLGAENLRDEDRRGATLDTPAWAMGRWTGWTLDVVD